MLAFKVAHAQLIWTSGTRSWPLLSYTLQPPKPHVHARPQSTALSTSVSQTLQIPCKMLFQGWSAPRGHVGLCRGREGMLSGVAFRKPSASLSMGSCLWACCCRPLAVQHRDIPEQGKLIVTCYSSMRNLATAVLFEERCFEAQAGRCHTVWMIAITASNGQALRTRVMDVARNARHQQTFSICLKCSSIAPHCCCSETGLSYLHTSSWSMRVCVTPMGCSCRELLGHRLLFMWRWAQSAFNPQTWIMWIRVAEQLQIRPN